MGELWKPTITETDQPLYLAVVRALANDIEAGLLATDTRLLTHREMADQLGVAVGTVTRAYVEAERRGLIRSEGRRGTFVGASHSGLSRLAAIASKPARGIDLSKNHPLYSLDPDITPALRQLARSSQVGDLLEYPPAPGLMRHREAGARWLTKLGARAEAESVFVTLGAQHALSVIMGAYCRRGDIVAAEQFTYTGVKAIAEQMELQMTGIPTDTDGILPDALESCCKQKNVRVLYCHPSLNNPTNFVTPLSRRKKIAQVAEKYGLTIIEDEIMRPLLDEHPGYISNLLPDQSFLVVSASKAISAGLRVGFVLAPTHARQRLVEGLNASCLGAPPLTTELLATWLENGEVDRLIARRREDTADRQQLTASLLDGFDFRSHPNSYHVWLKLPEGWSSMRFTMEAQQRGVAVAPGEAFAVESKLPYEAVRLSVVVPPTTEILRAGLQTIAGLLRGESDHSRATV